MKAQLNLSIPTPCHEKWENFTSTSEGGFCSSCRKVIIDFTGMSEAQISDHFLNSHGAACGRFRLTQLKTYSIAKPDTPTTKLLPLSLLGMSLLAPAAEVVAEKLNHEKQEVVVSSAELHRDVKKDTTIIKTITGIIKDENGTPMPGVNIVLKNTKTGTTSNVDGWFSITIPQAKATDVLVISFIGYETVEKDLSENEFTLHLKPDPALDEVIVMGGVCARRFTPRSVWWRIKSVFR